MKVKADNISRRYFRRSQGSNVFYAVTETDFSLSSGELTVIIGRSGSGKSTLLNMLAGILQPTGGHVYYDETDIYALDDAKRSAFRNREIGVIAQGQTGLQSLTVLENILLPSRMYAGEDKTVAGLALLERVGIAHLQGVYPAGKCADWQLLGHCSDSRLFFWRTSRPVIWIMKIRILCWDFCGRRQIKGRRCCW